MRQSRTALEQERDELEARIREIQSAGEVLTGLRLEKSGAGGTAGRGCQGVVKYARLRSRSGTFPDGSKSRYVPISEIPQYEAAIARGKEFERLKRRLGKLSEILLGNQKTD